MGDEGKVKEGEGKTFTQEQLDGIVQERLAREKGKFADYDELRKFKTEFEKSQDAKQLQLLEEQKKYQEAKDTYEKKIAEHQGIISKKDLEIQDMRISTSLAGAVNSQNAYVEETMALLKSQAVIDKENNVRIKGRDANGLEVLYSVEEGVKQFLTQRPHLVKATNRNGAGTPPNNPGGGAGAGDDLHSLNAQFAEAQRRGDHKAMAELKPKMRAAMLKR